MDDITQLLPGSLHSPPQWSDAVLPEERENWNKPLEPFWSVVVHPSSNGFALVVEQATTSITLPVIAWRAIYDALKQRYES